MHHLLRPLRLDGPHNADDLEKLPVLSMVEIDYPVGSAVTHPHALGYVFRHKQVLNHSVHRALHGSPLQRFPILADQPLRNRLLDSTSKL